MKIEIVLGNIVRQPDVEAVVNSANAHLRLGSGVAGAIHTAAGRELEEHCKPHAPLPYGAYLVTPGFGLPNPWVIHVRAASYLQLDEAPDILRQAVEAMLLAAQSKDIRRLAWPAIGTGVFAFPPELAAATAAQVMARSAELAPDLQLARLCVAHAALLDVYRTAFTAVGIAVHTMESPQTIRQSA